MIFLQNVYNVASDADAYLDAVVKLFTTVAVPLASLYFSWRMNVKTQGLQRELNGNTEQLQRELNGNTAQLQRELNDRAGHLQRDLAKLNIDEKRIEEKRKDISRRLDEFYGPLQQYLNKSAELYKIFVKGKPVSEDPDKGFRTLTYLLNPDQEYPGIGRITLSENDKVILEEIVKIGSEIETLIIEKASLADDPSLTYKYESPKDADKESWEDKNNGLLAVLGTHLLTIRYAFGKKISGDVDIYKNYVYPRPINAIIQSKIDKLNKDLNELRTSE